ncbi:hypothetical protein MUP77_12320 [Candidatus Bathyarchaeota archaeon]|nr:hypothetical protein [Candidatus Bathyarchaeota archaeon]
MPYSDEEEQRTAVREAMKRLRARRKLEAEATNQKFEETIPETPENLNYGMEPTRDKPLTWDEYLTENPKADKTEWIHYKMKFSLEHKWKSEIEQENKRKARDEQSKYGTREHDCILWRRMYSKGQKSDFLYNHIDSCRDCMKWYATQKQRGSLDMNDVGKKSDSFPELDGYAEVFKPERPFPEDFIGHPSGATFPMNKCCSNCGSPLDKDGKCTFCDQ